MTQRTRAAEPLLQAVDVALSRSDTQAGTPEITGLLAVADAAPTPAPAHVTLTAAPFGDMRMSAGASQPASSPAAAATGAHIRAPVDSDAFAPALGLQVSAMARDGIQHARLQLNPAELGPITVKIAMDGCGARIDFQADAAATRQAIEASLPALAGALRESGLTLTGGGVFQHPQGRPSTPDAAPGAARSAAAGDDGGGAPAASDMLRAMPPRRGLVDLVA